jgi:hypothetical protein
MKRGISSLLAATVLGLASSFGAAAPIVARPPHAEARGAGPKKPPRLLTQLRQQAAQAKRLQRQSRNLDRQSRGAYGARRI